jgi:hypothetical protein
MMFNSVATKTDDEVWGPKSHYFGTGEDITDYMTTVVHVMKQRGFVENESIKQFDHRYRTGC